RRRRRGDRDGRRGAHRRRFPRHRAEDGAAEMTTQAITLYIDGYFVNQWDASCFVALTEKQLPFATARALLRDGAGVPPALRERTSVARVPAFQHGDTWLTESSAIIEYLEDTFAPPEHPRLLPAEPRRRARARQLMSWLRFELAELRDQRPWWM